MIPGQNQEFSAAVKTSCMCHGEEWLVPWDSQFLILEADPSAVGSPPSSFPSCRKGLWVFQPWNRKEVGILFTYPLSCAHLFKTPLCPTLLMAVAPRLSAVLSLPSAKSSSWSIVPGGPELPQLEKPSKPSGLSRGVKSPALVPV